MSIPAPRHPASPRRTRTAVIIILAAAAIAAGASAAIAAFGGPAHHPPRKHAAAGPAATVTPDANSGCGQAALIIAAVRSNLHADPSGTALALHQIQSLARTLPDEQPRLDIDHAALDLALFREYMLMGGPAAHAAKSFAADLNKITAECG